MALRVKNMSRGWVYGSPPKFHPDRSADDYDPTELNDNEGARARGEALYPKRKRKARKVRKSAKPKHKPRAKLRARKKNPISAKWVKAQVRRVGKDIQVMLFPKKRTVRRRRR